LVDDIDLGFYFWAVLCREYIRLRRSGFPVSAIRYEDIIKNRRFATQAILEYCDLPTTLTDKALRGLEVDSQRNSPISKAILQQFPDPVVTEGSKKRGNAFMKDFGLPSIESNGILDGTITYEKPSKND